MPPKLHLPPKSQQLVDTNPRGGSFLLHTLSVAFMFSGFRALNNVAFGKMVSPEYGGLWQYLTILGLLASGLTLILAAASDLLPAIRVLKSLKRAFMLISLPVEVVIASIYWPLVLFMPQLMLPPKTGAGTSEPSSDPGAALFYIPLWMDLSMHAVPAIVLLFDFMFLEKKYTPPLSTIGAPALAAAVGASYGVWVEHCASINGRFPYPFLTMMSFPGRIAMYVGATVGAWAVFQGLNRVHR